MPTPPSVGKVLLGAALLVPTGALAHPVPAGQHQQIVLVSYSSDDSGDGSDQNVNLPGASGRPQASDNSGYQDPIPNNSLSRIREQNKGSSQSSSGASNSSAAQGDSSQIVQQVLSALGPLFSSLGNAAAKLTGGSSGSGLQSRHTGDSDYDIAWQVGYDSVMSAVKQGAQGGSGLLPALGNAVSDLGNGVGSALGGRPAQVQPAQQPAPQAPAPQAPAPSAPAPQAPQPGSTEYAPATPGTQPGHGHMPGVESGADGPTDGSKANKKGGGRQ